MSIEAAERLNGHAPDSLPRVRFGPRPTQIMPLDWAEFMLSEMRAAQENNRKPEQFGTLLARAAMEAGR
jgi:hypothetical protein